MTAITQYQEYRGACSWQVSDGFMWKMTTLPSSMKDWANGLLDYITISGCSLCIGHRTKWSTEADGMLSVDAAGWWRRIKRCTGLWRTWWLEWTCWGAGRWRAWIQGSSIVTAGLAVRLMADILWGILIGASISARIGIQVLSWEERETRLNM
jgi:hypothetical protein